MTFDLEAFCNAFNPDPDRPSPDFSDPVMARRLMVDIPRLAHAAGLRPPTGWDEDCWHQELRETLLKRSRGRGKWDPARGRTTWSSWATMCMQTRNMNLYRLASSPKGKVLVLCSTGQMEAGMIENYAGEGIGLQNGIPKHQRTSKNLQARARRAQQQRDRRAAQAAQAAALAVV